MDEVNSRVLTELQRDPRITMAELARRVGMSAPAVTERVQRLEQSGVVTGYRLELDPATLGWPIAAFVRVRPTGSQLSKIIELAEALPQVSECHRITGEDCLLLKVHAATMTDLETALDRFLVYGQTVSSIIVSTPIPPRPLPTSVTEPEPGRGN